MRFICLMLFAFVSSSLAQVQMVSVATKPGTIYIERREDQLLNFDMLVTNHTAKVLTLDRVEISIFDRGGRLELRKYMDTNGFNPAISTISNRELQPGQTNLFFNPFYSFDPALELSKLTYELTFSEKVGDKEYKARFSVNPTLYVGKADLLLPLQGRLIVQDGHDFYAHHRRLDYALATAQHYGLHRNFMRYAYDLCLIDEAGHLFNHDGLRNEDWYSFDAPLRAPGAGRVVATHSEQPDNIRNGKNYFDAEKLVSDPMSFYGNYVTIDHGNGEFSVLGHMRQGSLKVKVGEVVRQGAEIGRVGTSGSADNPHVHYELRTGNGLGVEGLPSYFSNFERLLGSRILVVPRGQIDSGDMVRSLAQPSMK